MSDYTKIKHIVNALNDIEDIAVRIEFDETLQRTYYKVAFVVDNLVSAGFTEDDMITLSDTINKAVKKALLKTERSLLAELEGELGSVKDSLTALFLEDTPEAEGFRAKNGLDARRLKKTSSNRAGTSFTTLLTE